MSFLAEKNKGSSYSTAALSPNETTRTTSKNGGFTASLSDLEKKDQIYKKRIRILRFISRVASLLLNAYMVGTMAYALSKYFLTKNKIISGNQHPWATPTTLWPTIMLLAIATITFLMNFVTICTYLCGVGAANKTDNLFSKIGYILTGVHILVWAVALGLFRMARQDAKDLWGFSCSSNADAIQAEVNAFLDFGKLCTTQTGAWYSMIIETVTYAVTFIVIILALARSSTKKKIARVKSGFSMEEGYTQNVETGSAYEPGLGKRYMPVAVESHV